MTPKFFSEIIEIIETAYRLKAEKTHKAKEQEKSKPNRTIKIRKNPHKGITPISIISIISPENLGVGFALWLLSDKKKEKTL